MVGRRAEAQRVRLPALRERDARRPAANLVGDAGDEDHEHPQAPQTSKTLHVQSSLTQFMDECIYEGLVNHHTQADSGNKLFYDTTVITYHLPQLRYLS